jgi:hypothetical protein
MRVYIPATLPMLARWHAAGRIDAETGHAVTLRLRQTHGVDDVEQLEYTALTDAASASLRLLAAEPTAPRRRVVVAVDVTAAALDASAAASAVRLDGDGIPFDAVASVHVDGDDATEDDDLLWYATQEVPGLVA